MKLKHILLLIIIFIFIVVIIGVVKTNEANYFKKINNCSDMKSLPNNMAKCLYDDYTFDILKYKERK